MNSIGKVKWKLRYYGVKMLGKIPGFLDGGQYYCNLCGSTSRFFMSYGTKSKVAFSMIGSGDDTACSANGQDAKLAGFKKSPFTAMRSINVGMNHLIFCL